MEVEDYRSQSRAYEVRYNITYVKPTYRESVTVNVVAESVDAANKMAIERLKLRPADFVKIHLMGVTPV